MKEILITVRNRIEKILYKGIVKKIFFLIDPETTHNMMLGVGKILGKTSLTRALTALCFKYSNIMLEQDIFGIHFPNPVGLAAGFDKNAHLTEILPSVGFGFIEIGSVTGQPCAGNPKPRLWRLPKSQGIVVNYGLMNDGCEVIANRLKGKKCRPTLGISIAKTNCPETVETKKGIQDYAKAFRELKESGQYIAVNISCPNAFGGQPFIDKKRLNMLLKELDKIKTTKPVLLKVSPDLSRKEIDDIIEVAKHHRVHGFILTNLSKKREHLKILEKNIPPKGSISGKVIEKIANEHISYVYKKTKGKFIIIGVGGIFSAEDAYRKIKLGASLVQLMTGMIFEGPQVISEINQGLVKLLKKDGYKNISEAIGTSHR